jgi:hypothetical protein
MFVLQENENALKNNLQIPYKHLKHPSFILNPTRIQESDRFSDLRRLSKECDLRGERVYVMPQEMRTNKRSFYKKSKVLSSVFPLFL